MLLSRPKSAGVANALFEKSFRVEALLALVNCTSAVLEANALSPMRSVLW